MQLKDDFLSMANKSLKRNFYIEGSNIYEKLKFVIVFRFTAISLAILTYLLILINHGSDLFFYTEYEIFIFLVIIVVLLTVIYSFINYYIKKKNKERYFALFGLIQIIFDFILISVFVILNGGLESNLIFLYYLLVLMAGFIFLGAGIIFFTVASSLVIGFIADLQFYFNVPGHYYYLYEPDKLLFALSLNIFGLLIFGWILYKFSNNIKYLSNKVIEIDEVMKNAAIFNKELINSFTQGVIVLNVQNNIVFINKSGMDLIGPDVFDDSIVGKAGSFYHFNLKIDDIFKDFPLNIFDEEKAGSIRFEVKHNGKIIGFAYSEFKDNKSPGRRILLFKDISYVKELELDSKINEGLIATGKLAGWLAHEIRNPLSAINTSIDILNSDNIRCSTIDAGDNNTDFSKLTGIIKTETIRLESLVKDFLGFVNSKTAAFNTNEIGNSVNFEHFNLHDFSEYIISQFKSSKDYNIINRIDNKIDMYFEKYRLHQIFVNIIENAAASVKLRYKNNLSNNTKGKIRISAMKISGKFLAGQDEYSESEYENSKQKAVSDFLIMKFYDNGEGIGEDVIKNIFKPLFTTKKNGTGLGLSIVKSIIDNFNGNISIKSKKNKGTLINITLPLYEHKKR
jgi:signal transduction histidine kinase